jgi:hypothetical protein
MYKALSLTPTEEHRLWVFENGVLGNIYMWASEGGSNSKLETNTQYSVSFTTYFSDEQIKKMRWTELMALNRRNRNA